MGGIAAIAREAGHRVTGSDQNVYPPMSTQLAALGIDIVQGFDAGAARSRARRGGGRQRDVARQAGDRGAARKAAFPMRRVRSGWRARCCAIAGCWPWPARMARPPPPACWRTSWTTRASRPGFLIGGVPGNFDISARLGKCTVLRDRGRRIRHGVLRQARQVRALPAAHAGAEQPGVRPRRHLPRPRGHPAAVQSPAAHRAGQRAASCTTRPMPISTT